MTKQMTLTLQNVALIASCASLRNETEVTTFRPLVTNGKRLKTQGHRDGCPSTQTKVTLTTMRSWTIQMEGVALAAVEG